MENSKAFKYSLLICVFFYVNFGSYLGCKLYAQNKEMGMGFFAPDFSEGETLYLFDAPNGLSSPGEEKAIDSISFKRSGYNVVIDYAPSWFQPIHQKLDYGIFLIRVKQLGREYHELIVNESTGRTAYIPNYKGKFSSWPEFLVAVFSVEFISDDEKIYDNPTNKSSGKIYDKPSFRARYIKGDWMEVEILDANFKKTGTGWIRWRKDNKLLISYNLLS